jgi:dTDP-glucose pyrophosphorylase
MKDYIISPNSTLKDALKEMDKASNKILFVHLDRKLIGAVSDGDIRRAILNNVSLSSSVKEIMNRNPLFLSLNYDLDDVKKTFLHHEIQALPILNENQEIVEILFWPEVFGKKKQNYKNLNIPVVIMAGGRGTRLEPFTNILPKPLIPINDKPIIEIIMDEYSKFGVDDIFISVNFKSRMLKAYFEDTEKKYKIEYLEENKPLGTAGALKLLEGKVNSSFFVSNCDIIIKDDYSKIYEFHKSGNFDMTLVASVQHHVVPYGVCTIGDGGELNEIIEKPEYDFLVNTGMYILEPTVLKYIPENTLYHITNLMADLQKQGKKVGVYPVSEKSWIDIGQWSEYKKNLSLFESFIKQ